MAELVSESNKEFLEDVSPSKLQQLVSELFRTMLSRKEDMSMRNKFSKKIESYLKRQTIALVKSDGELEDKVLEDVTDREKDRIKVEDDILDELKIYDLRVISDYWK